MAASSFTFGRSGASLSLLLSALAGRVEDETAALVLRAAQHAVGEIRSVVYEVFPEGRTGQLARSFREVFIGKDGSGAISAAAQSDLVYARILDDGGTITPKTVKALAVPLKRLPIGKWPRHYGKDELTLIKSKRGNMILAKVTKTKGGKDRIDPHFVLVKRVTIRGRGYIAIAEARARPGIEEILEEGLQKIVDDTTSGGGAAGVANG